MAAGTFYAVTVCVSSTQQYSQQYNFGFGLFLYRASNLSDCT